MKSYEQFKRTSELWIETVPIHWNIKKIKYLFTERSEKGYPDEPLLVASQNMGVVPKHIYGNRTVEATKDLQNLKLVHTGDFVISLRSFQGGIEYAYYRGIISPAYTVMIPSGQMSTAYFRYLAKSRPFIELLQFCVTGIREGQNIDYYRLKNHYIPLPPYGEQDRIGHYLDWRVSKINKLISAKKREKVLVQERLLVAINDLLTNGVKEEYKIRSAIDWLEECPSSWRISRIRNHFIIQKRISGAEGYKVLSITQSGLKIKDIASNEGQIAKDYSGYQFVYPGDFAMNHMDLLTGYIGISEHLGVTSPDYRVFTLVDTENCCPEYFLKLFQLCYKRKIFYGFGRGAANKGRWRLPATNFMNFQIPLPPYDEQVHIAERIQCLENKYAKAIEHIEAQISVLHELRTRLISDVVTGQIDVRDIVVPDFEYVEEPSEESIVDGEEPQNDDSLDEGDD